MDKNYKYFITPWSIVNYPGYMVQTSKLVLKDLLPPMLKDLYIFLKELRYYCSWGL